MTTHVERRSTHRIDNHPIPDMTDPQGKYWDQPCRSFIEIDATHALMNLATFKELREYSGSVPTGVYHGKMWRRHDGVFDHAFLALGGKPRWMLCWYGPSSKGPRFYTTNTRFILLTDADVDAQESR